MKRLTILFIAVAAIVPGGISEAAGRAREARGAKLQLRHTALGNILVNGEGLTVYAFTRDTRNHDRCVTISGCPGIWPLVTTGGKPLYTYIGASGPGDTSYVGLSQFGGRWLALSATGHTVK
jgi:predicted lipoprotein with Yx(FWY)xxD motif